MHPIFEAAETPIHLAQISHSNMEDYFLHSLAEYPDNDIRTIHSPRVKEVQAFFDHMGTAYSFPFYFGNNWHALHDCLRDELDRQPKPHLLIFTRASHLMENENNQVTDCLFQVINSLNPSATKSCDPRQQVDTPAFHIMLADYESDFQQLKCRFQNVPGSRIITWNGQEFVPEDQSGGSAR